MFYFSFYQKYSATSKVLRNEKNKKNTPKYDPINVISSKNGSHLGFMPIVKNAQVAYAYLAYDGNNIYGS